MLAPTQRMALTTFRGSPVTTQLDGLDKLGMRGSYRHSPGALYDLIPRRRDIAGSPTFHEHLPASSSLSKGKCTSTSGDTTPIDLIAVIVWGPSCATENPGKLSCILLVYLVTVSTSTLLAFSGFEMSDKPLITNKEHHGGDHILRHSFARYLRSRQNLHSFAYGILRLACAPLSEMQSRKPAQYIHFNDFKTTLQTLFSFLRYTGPRRLRRTRKVVADNEVYHITHIGQGAFAAISRVLYKPTGEVRVMKRITFDESGLAEYLAKNEINALKAMKGSVWFPPLLNDFVERGEYVVTMPYYHRGDLAAFIEHKRFLGRDVAQFYSAQLLLAIQSLHKQGIVHRDIKTDNIFLDAEGHLVLADLGLAENITAIEGGEDTIKEKYPKWMHARTVGGDEFPFLWADDTNPLGMRGGAGTFWYTAPEVFRKERYSFGVDYWSLGVIYHELITGHIPFEFGIQYPEDKRPILDFTRKPGQLKDVELWEEYELCQLLSPYIAGRPKTVGDIKNLRIFRGVDWKRMSLKQIPPPRLPLPLEEDGWYGLCTRGFH